jgi:two-component system invasion response regulator UvrY
MLEIGARGYLTKECNVNSMVEAIKTVHEGGSYIEPAIAQQLALSMMPGNNNVVDKLSRREFQVMIMLANGLTNMEISEKLCLSPKTVSTYRSRIMEKIDAVNEVDLVKIAVEMGMVDFTQEEIVDMLASS